jgi:hypothetical protein
MDLGFVRGGVRAAAIAALVASVTPSIAKADDTDCGPRQTLVRIDQKVCPANDRRPAIVRERACCEKANGKVHCGHMPHCPRNSPS